MSSVFLFILFNNFVFACDEAGKEEKEEENTYGWAVSVISVIISR